MDEMETITIEVDGQEIKIELQNDGTFRKPNYLLEAMRLRGGVTATQCSYFPEPCLGHGYENSQSGVTIHPLPTLPATQEAEKWDGWGTAMKPSFEPIILARKPIAESSVARNVLKHGTGAINVDECRLDTQPPKVTGQGWDGATGYGRGDDAEVQEFEQPDGRWPTNTVFTHSPLCNGVCDPSCPIAELDRQSGYSRSEVRSSEDRDIPGNTWALGREGVTTRGHTDEGGASRFFPCFRFEADDFFPFQYTPKPSKREKENGLERLPIKTKHRVNAGGLENEPRFAPIQAKNHHPTVKPTSLMAWLIRLVCPPDGVVLDPFGGSGTTGVAAMQESKKIVLVELDPDFCEIIKGRTEEARLGGRQLDLLEVD